MKKFEQTLEEIAALAEKNLEKAQELSVLKRRKKTLLYLLMKYIVKDFLFQPCVKMFYRQAKGKLPKWTVSERKLDIFIAPLKTPRREY